MSGRKLGRNEPCPCGSGKKYKNCCSGKRFDWVTDGEGHISRQFPIDDPELLSLLDQARTELRNEHGSDSKPDDFLFNKPMDEKDIERTMVDIMERAGIEPAFIYAFKKTRRIITTRNKDKLSEAELQEWQGAIDEYHAATKKSEQTRKSGHYANGGVYQLKVTLTESKPPIWRRFQVAGNITLHRLHLILQDVMGWTNSHLYRFDIGGIQYSIPDPEEDEFNGLHFVDSRRTKLSKVVPREKARFTYEYDFGDSWEHEILVEKMISPESGAQYPVCLAGKRACPPEDCGGIWAYEELEYHGMIEWLGGSFDPEEFDIARVNRILRRSHRAKRPRHADVPAALRDAFETEDKE
jgi:hypothetical protein